jgi:D-alanyl-D-alanine carboxypeptidase
MRRVLLALALSLGLPAALRAADTAELTATIQSLADAYLSDRATAEGISGLSVSLSLPGQAPAINVAAGTLSPAPGSAPVTSGTLYQIGSITKSMTAAVLLQLQTEGLLGLDDPLSVHLPEYPAWKDVTLRRLLNMTSGIPTYDAADAFFADQKAQGNARHYAPAVLVGFVDPAYPQALAPTTGYSYSNTNYMLAGMVIAKVTGQPVPEVFVERLFGARYGLTDTHYAEGIYPEAIRARMPAGISAQGGDEMAAFRGRNFTDQDMSWAGAAGAAVATPEQVTVWVRTLFRSDTLLTEAARAELMDVVSTRTGTTIGRPTAEDPSGFGLGVAGFDSSVLGSGWQYEGGSMGFRVAYIWLPDPDIVVAVGMNSNVDGDADHIGKLAESILQAAMK